MVTRKWNKNCLNAFFALKSAYHFKSSSNGEHLNLNSNETLFFENILIISHIPRNGPSWHGKGINKYISLNEPLFYRSAIDSAKLPINDAFKARRPQRNVKNHTQLSTCKTKLRVPTYIRHYTCLSYWRNAFSATGYKIRIEFDTLRTTHCRGMEKWVFFSNRVQGMRLQQPTLKSDDLSVDYHENSGDLDMFENTTTDSMINIWLEENNTKTRVKTLDLTSLRSVDSHFAIISPQT